MFMSYDALNALSETQISCYELVCAIPISGYALAWRKPVFPRPTHWKTAAAFLWKASLRLSEKQGNGLWVPRCWLIPLGKRRPHRGDTYGRVFGLAVILIIYPLVYAIWMAVVSSKRLKQKIQTAVPRYLKRAVTPVPEADGG
jgi:hypothetical protein